MERTSINLFEESVKKFSNNPLVWEKNKDKYESTSYAETKK
ncbi:hypothetical protein [Stygiobacter electus]|uniref:Uncharacterized protein n=1 Tax=Stygiobacter electus TaxID=3032292 RepID=A0AAE3NZT0_9BACT|nr:hypothetical protein [Stygiobacter electus]MDF1611744.1 hypothetical protein [Stygiobacter electus]